MKKVDMLYIVSIVPLLLVSTVFEHTLYEDSIQRYTSTISNVFLTKDAILSIPLGSIETSIRSRDSILIRVQLILLTKVERVKQLSILCILSTGGLKVLDSFSDSDELAVLEMRGMDLTLKCVSMKLLEDRVVLEYDPIELKVNSVNSNMVIENLRISIVNLGSPLIVEKAIIVVELLS